MNCISKRKQTFYMGSKKGGGEEEVLRRTRTIAQIKGWLASRGKRQAYKAHFNRELSGGKEERTLLG